MRILEDLPYSRVYGSFRIFTVIIRNITVVIIAFYGIMKMLVSLDFLEHSLEIFWEVLIIVIGGFNLIEDLRYFRGITVLVIKFYGTFTILVFIVFIRGC